MVYHVEVSWLLPVRVVCLLHVGGTEVEEALLTRDMAYGPFSWLSRVTGHTIAELYQ